MQNLGVNFKKYYMYLTVFITGAVVLVIEILGTRIVAPYYGTTVYVWSSLIGVTMLALTAGYFLGGWLSDKRPNFSILYSIILAAAAVVFIVPFMAAGVLAATNSLGPRAGALASSAILFTLPLVLLGMVSPYAIRLSIGELKDAGLTAGSLYGVSTVGSFIGAIATGFFLIPMLGIKAIMDIMAALLILISLGWFIFGARKKAIAAVLIGLLLATLANPHTDAVSYRRKTTILLEKQSLYSKLKIVDYVDRYRGMIIDNALQTIYDKEKGEYAIGYIKMLADCAVTHRKTAKTALAIGLGGGAMDKVFRLRGIDVDNVEIDPLVVKCAKDYFGFDGKIAVDDGRHYVRNTSKKYDIILLDAYNGYSVSQFLISKEAFLEMKGILNPGGLLLVNTVGKLKNDGKGGVPMDKLVLAVNSTLKAAFNHVSIVSDNYGIANYAYSASDEPLAGKPEYMAVNISKEGRLLTDDYNPVESLTNDIIEDWRTEEMRRVGGLFTL